MWASPVAQTPPAGMLLGAPALDIRLLQANLLQVSVEKSLQPSGSGHTAYLPQHRLCSSRDTQPGAFSCLLFYPGSLQREAGDKDTTPQRCSAGGCEHSPCVMQGDAHTAAPISAWLR